MASIYKRSQIWWIIYYENGRKIQRSLKTRDKTIAKFKKNDLENQLAKGDSPIPNFNISPYVVLEEYREFCKNRNKLQTISDDTTRIKDFLGWAQPSRIKDVNEKDVLAYLNQRIDGKEIIPSTANHTITNIKTFLNFSVQRRYISSNPLRGIKKYKTEKLPPRFLNKEEIRNVLVAASSEPIHPMIITAIYTGMRLGELKRLTWGDIDFSRGEIMVRISKSSKFRIIPLHKNLKKELFKIKGAPAQLCFNYQNKRRIFKRIKRKAKLHNIGFHTFRHTFASQLIMAGVDLVTVSKLLGHAGINTTMIYSHLSQEHIKESIKRLTI
jgi:integrase